MFTPLSPISVLPGCCFHTAVKNVCNDTGVVSTPPPLLCVAPSRAVSLGDSTVAVKNPVVNGGVGGIIKKDRFKMAAGVSTS